MNTFDQIKNNPVNRRAFLQRMGAAGLGVAAIALLDGCGGGGNSNGNNSGNFPIQSLPGRNDNEKVLNFALTLEILEADLYKQALNIAAGKTDINADLTAPGDYTLAVSSGLSATQAAFAYLRDFAFVEAAHRDFLDMSIRNGGGTPVTRNAKGYQFPASANITRSSSLKDLLTAIYPLEEEGVSAYLGAAPFLKDFELLRTAVTIYSTEARHSAAIAYILGIDTGPQKNVPGVGPRQDVILNGKSVYDGLSQGKFFEYFIPPQQVAGTDIQPLIVK